MLMIAVTLAAIVAFLSQSVWSKRLVSGISPTALYAMIWALIWEANIFVSFGYAAISLKAAVLSVLPLIGLYIGEASSFLHFQQERGYRGRMDELKLRRFGILIGVVACSIGILSCAVSWLSYGNSFIYSSLVLKADRVTEGVAAFGVGTAALPGPLRLIWGYGQLLRGLPIVSLVLLCMSAHSSKRYLHWTMLLPIFSAILLDLAWGSRMNLYLLLTVLVAFWFFVPARGESRTQKRVQWRAYVVVAIGMGLLGLVANILTTQTHEEETGDIGGVSVPKAIEQFLHYHLGTLATFSETLDENRLTWGRMSFQGVEQGLRLLRILPQESLDSLPELVMWEEHAYFGALNTYSWLRYLYSDFGALGLLVLPALLGYLGGAAACQLHDSKGRNYHAFGRLYVCYCVIEGSPIIMLFREDYFVLCVLVLFGSLSIIARWGAREVKI